MNIHNTAAMAQSLKSYVEKDITGAELSQSISENVESAEGLSKKQQTTFRYYINFFEKEGGERYQDSNIYLKDEVNELNEFLSGFLAV